MILASPTVIARRFSFVREVEGPNAGTWVSFFQRFTGNRPGDSWCASFVSVVLDIVYRGVSPLKRSASCDELLTQALAKGWIVPKPQMDDLYFFITPGHPARAHHVGIVTATGPSSSNFVGIAGNTSESGASPDGTGVFEHVIDKNSVQVLFVRLPRN